MNDRIQLSFAQAPATTNQNGSFRFFDTRARRRPATRRPTRCSGLFDDYTEFGNKPNTKWLAMAYDLYVQDSWKPTRDLTLELGLRYSLWQPWGTTNRAMASFDPAFYDAGRAAVIDRAGGFVVGGDRFNGIVLPGDGPTDEAIADFPQLANLQRLYHGVPNGFSETPKDGFQPRLGLAYAINERTTFRAGVGRFLNRVQINTTAAYGFNPPLSEMQTVINGNVDAPGGAATRNFPLVMAMQSPDFTNPTSWAWNATLDRELPWQMRGTLSVRRPVGVESRARAQHQPAAAGHDSGQSGRERQRAAAVPRLRHHHALRDDRQVALQQPADAGRAPLDARRRLQRRLHVLADQGRRQRPQRYPARTPTTTAATTASRISIGRTCWCRRCAIASRRSTSAAAPLRWVLGNWDVSGIFQAQSGAPFTVRAANQHELNEEQAHRKVTYCCWPRGR